MQSSISGSALEMHIVVLVSVLQNEGCGWVVVFSASFTCARHAGGSKLFWLSANLPYRLFDHICDRTESCSGNAVV